MKKDANACLICGAPLVYLPEAKPMECAGCGRTFTSNAMCENGHFICDDCHRAPALVVIRQRCLQADDTDPIGLAEKLMQGEDKFADGWNFGPYAAGATTVSEIIDLFYAKWGDGRAEYDKEAPILHEAAFLTLSSEKAMKELGWKPTWTLEENVEHTARWYQRFYAGEDARELTLGDIDEYMKQMEY